MSFIEKIFGKNKMYELFFDENGLHQIGGEIPENFTVPQNEFKSNFQYIGFINNVDPILNWLPFNLNLICPIYLDFEIIYLDYQNENAPKILYPENTSEIGSAYRTLDLDSIIIFEAKRVSNKEFSGVTEENQFDIIGLTGRPNFYQNQNIPLCPKTNKKMKFVCQLTSWTEVKTKFTNVIAEDDYEQDLFSKMNFWCDGDLYVFMQPESKTVCYFIQGT